MRANVFRFALRIGDIAGLARYERGRQLRRPYSPRPSSLLSQPALFSVSLVLCQRLVGQFALRTFKRAQIGTSKAGLDTDQHHANLALGAARPLDHARGMRFRYVMHSPGSGGSATLSVTDNSRRRGRDSTTFIDNMSGS